MATVIVIAKTHEQFINACNQRRLSTRTTPWITSAVQIARLTGSIIPIFIGDFWNLPGYQEMEIAMKVKGIKTARDKYVNPNKGKWGT